MQTQTMTEDQFETIPPEYYQARKTFLIWFFAGWSLWVVLIILHWLDILNFDPVFWGAMVAIVVGTPALIRFKRRWGYWRKVEMIQRREKTKS